MTGREEGVGFQPPAINRNGAGGIFRQIVEQAAQQKTRAVDEGMAFVPLVVGQNRAEVVDGFFVVV